MALNTSDLRLFGLDLRVVADEVSVAWRSLWQSPLLRWLKPNVALRVWSPEYLTALWHGKGAVSQSFEAAVQPLAFTQFHALVLPEDIVLRRHFQLPAIAQNDIDSAVALDAQNSTPFAEENSIWAYQAKPNSMGGFDIELIIIARSHVRAYLDELQSPTLSLTPDLSNSPNESNSPASSDSSDSPSQNAPSARAMMSTSFAKQTPELWVLASDQTPIVLSGFGEANRSRYVRVWHRVHAVLFVAFLMCLLLLAVTPTLQLRSRAIEAVYQYDDLTFKTAGLLKQRDAMIQLGDQVNTIKDIASNQINALEIMTFLTQIIPDDTFIFNLQMQNPNEKEKAAGHDLKITLSGQTPNTAELMQKLSNQPRLHDVKSPSEARKSFPTGKEIFSIEFFLSPPPPPPKPETEEQTPESAHSANAESKTIANSPDGSKEKAQSNALIPEPSRIIEAPASTPAPASPTTKGKP